MISSCVTQTSVCAFRCLPSSGRKAGSPRRNPESGFAMLLVFALAAIVALGLYEQLPRVAFEAQREKEQLLIDHGEQYVRGVQLYVRKMGRYPAKMEDLDNTQNVRFLRKHYIDPMTGKDEWRLLHMGPAGKLIDSKIQTNDPNKTDWHAGSITEFKSAASSEGGPEGANLAVRKRPSDEQAPTSMPGVTPGDPNQTASNALPGSAPGGGLPGMPPLPGANSSSTNAQGTQGAQGQNGTAGSANSGSQSSISGNGGFGASISGNGGYGTPSTTQGQTGQAGQIGQQAGTAGQQSYSTTPGANQPNSAGFGQPGQQASGAAGMINNLLTSPRPGGMPAGAGGTPGIGGSVVGGLAGVASTHKGHGVKHYNDQDEYEKWEFYYDLSKEIAAATPNVAATGATNPNGQQNSTTGSQNNGFSFGNSTQGTQNTGGFGTSNQAAPPPPPPSPPPPNQ